MTDQHEATDPGQALLTVLRDLLNDASITADNDYYAVGGHSMLVVQVIRQEPLVVALPAEHPLVGDRPVPLADLAGDRFVSYPSHFRSVMHEATEAACRRAGFTPQVVQEAGETATLVSLVAAGIGVALVPASVQHLRITGATYRPLVDGGEVALAVASRSGDPSPVLARFLARVQTLVGLRPVPGG